jgi:AbiV family abortive infection protein
MMNVAADVLLKGAVYALEQCGILIRDAAELYRAKAYSSTVALAMIGREELGKYLMLMEEWSKVGSSAKPPTVEAIQDACDDHIGKQKRAVLGLAFTADRPSAFGKAIEAQIKYKPQDAEYQAAEKVIQECLEVMAKRAPGARHKSRMQALYVDLDDSGSAWSRPSEVPQGECKKLLNDAANDYANQMRRMNPDWLRGMGDRKLADALEGWPARPKLPEPGWVE